MLQRTVAMGEKPGFIECLGRFDEIRAAARALNLKVVETADDIRGASMMAVAGIRTLSTNSAMDRDRYHNDTGEREAVLEVTRLLMESVLDLAEAATEEVRIRTMR